MNLVVDLDPGLIVTETVIECRECPDACALGANVCLSDGDADRVTAALPGTLVLWMDPEGGYLGGWRAEIEVDLDVMTARLCCLPVTDEACGRPVWPPECATSGALGLSRSPAMEADLPGLAGVVDATFADGLRIVGEFVLE